MKYVFQLARILGFCLAGELLAALLPLPVPGSIWGMLLLLAALRTGLVKAEQIREASRFLTGIFLLLFIPGAVGIIEHPDLLGAVWLPALLAVTAVTALVFGAAGKATDWIIGRKHDA